MSDKEKRKTVKTIAYAKIQTMINDEMTITDNYYIIDYEIDIKRLEEVIRDRWNIECGLHWKLYVILDNDC